jgi:hypothetical protein
MREAPVIKIKPPPFREGVGYAMREVGVLVREIFEALPEETQAEVMSLHSYITAKEKGQPRVDELMPIFRSNAYTSGKEIGLFPRIARINHSCRPNASYFWNEQLNRRVVYATRSIDPGEEIFVSYIPLLHSHADRQKRLDQYGFKCSCTACAADAHFQQLSDRRRAEIRQSINDLEKQLTLHPAQTVAAKKKMQRLANESQQLVDTVEEEELADYYAQCYRIAAIFHAQIRDWRSASSWAGKSFQLKMMADANSQETKEMEMLTSRFIANWENGLRDKDAGND